MHTMNFSANTAEQSGEAEMLHLSAAGTYDKKKQLDVMQELFSKIYNIACIECQKIYRSTGFCLLR